MQLTLGVNICSVCVPSSLVWWRHINHSNYAVLQCYGEYGLTPYSLLIWARPTLFQLLLLVATELFRIPLVATRRNDEKTSSCGDTLLPLNRLDDQNDEKRISIRGRDCLRKDPLWFPGHLNCCSRMFSERLRNKFELVGSVFDKFWQGTQDTRICPTEFFWEFFSYPPFDLFRNPEDVVLSQSGSSVFCVLQFLVPSGVSLETAASFLLFLKVALDWGKKFYQR